MFGNHQLRILNHTLQTGGEVEVSVVEVEVEVVDILKLNFEIDILILGLELPRTFVVVVEGLKNYDWMPL